MSADAHAAIIEDFIILSGKFKMLSVCVDRLMFWIFFFFYLKVLTLIEKSIYDPCLYGSSSTVFLHFSYLMRAWKKLSRTKTVFDEIYKQAWIRVHQLLNYSLHFEDNMGKDDFEKRLRAHQKFINLLKNPHDVRLKKQLKVRGFYFRS